MSTISARLFSDVFTDVRGLLNDEEVAGGEVFFDTKLLPLAAQIHGELQDEFANNDIEIAEKMSTAFSYTAHATSIPIPGAVTDFYQPIQIWERATTASEWKEVKMVDDLRVPGVIESSTLREFSFDEGTILVNPCSTNRLLLVRYQKQLAYPTAAGAVTIDGFYFPLVAGTAWLAAFSRGREEAATDRLRAMYEKRMEDAINRGVQGGQTIRRGPKPHLGYRHRVGLKA